ncbi:hypothetical protein FN846DRAFT_904474 [Sphaerosporella brunnea]|uniref:MULE transposase domain-containing protein n=1 Tax=Sphaerosporella brunnea TaxID=1250544 RepID=A0A5J5F489_9PEZI|nr:hypothetical protein FN846DRAFT_904474 [Sphaerosporella brunnea]
MPRANPTVGGHPEEQQPEAVDSDSELQNPGQIAVHVDCPAVTVGDRFSTFQDFKARMRLHAILHGSRRLHSFLKENVPQIMTITNRTKPRDVMETVQKHLKARLKYGSAHKVLLSLQGKGIDLERDQFRLLPAYIELLKKHDPDGRYFLSMDDNTTRFQPFFTFTKNKFRQIILFADRLDGNNEVSLLAWAVVESENEESWRFLLTQLKM